MDRDLSASATRYAAPVAQKLDPYTEITDSPLKEFSKLSARRLFEEVRAAGYEGSTAACGLQAQGTA